ncbi:MAG: hypothetical protein Q8L28_00080 [bacterium]|nr:hypothetical protein [bacterium]
MQDSFSTLVDSATSILILLPNKPYFDQVAAGLALYLSLRDLPAARLPARQGEAGKKETSISCSSPMVVGFNRLIGVNKIGTELGSKNLTVKLKGYDANNIEKVSYDIVEGEFNLTIVPKAGLSSPTKEQVDFNYAGVSADLVILVGGANDGHFSALSGGKLTQAKLVHFGTRVLNTSVGSQIMSFAKPASSVSELIATVIKNEGLPMDADVATNLVMGMEDGTNHFEGLEVTPETFEVFAHLLRSGGQRPPKKMMAENFPAGAIPGMQVFNKGVQTEPKIDLPNVPFEQPEAVDVKGTKEEEQAINPPDDWLQPKVYKGSTSTQPDSYSENKG